MKGLRNKVILSGIVLMFAFIATIGTTYAWFTVSSTATIGQMTLNVQAEENLLIKVVPYNEGSGLFSPDYSADPAGYKSAITLIDLQNAGYVPSVTPWQILPSTIFSTTTTTHDTIDEKALHFIADPTDSARALTLAPFNNSSNGRYVQLQFIVMSQAAEAYPLEMRTIRMSATNGDVRDNVTEALRLSVWGSSSTAYTFGRDQDFSYSFDGKSGSSFDNLDTIVEIRTTEPTSEVIDIWDGTNWIDPTQDIITLAPNTPTLVTVNIYVEGWDIQADNYVIGAYFNISFAFTIGTTD
jgi:hypothetical protein